MPTAENSFELSSISLILVKAPCYGLWHIILGKDQGVAGWKRCPWDLSLPLWIDFHPKLFVFIRDFSQKSYHEQVRGVRLKAQNNWHPMREATAAGPLKAILSGSENVLHSQGWDLHCRWHARVRVSHAAVLGSAKSLFSQANSRYWAFLRV